MSVRTVTQPVSGLGLKGSITLQERRIRFVRAVNRTARIRSRLRGAATTAGVTVLSALAIFLPPTSNADPDPAAPPPIAICCTRFRHSRRRRPTGSQNSRFPTTKPETASHRRISPPWPKCANGTTVNTPP